MTHGSLVAWAKCLLLLLAAAAITCDGHAAAECKKYSAMYANIDRDLARWKADGISLSLMEKTISAHTSYRRAPHSQKGFAAAFVNGTAVLLSPPELTSWTGHHGAIWMVYM